MTHHLDSIIHPRALAIVGASQSPLKRGNRLIKSLISGDYKGLIVPINPTETEILGFKSYPTLSDAPPGIDLALVCTSAKTVPDIIRQCGERGIKGAVLLAGGFSEASEEGRLLEEEVIEMARRHNVRLIGPNTSGMFSARLGCNATGWFDIPRGPLAILSNSANVLLSLVTESQFHGYMGINAMLSVGNQADIQFHEYLECFADDPDTTAIVSYIEGFKNGPAFMTVARQVAQSKPIVMYIAGRSAAGKGAAKSHSGSLAGDYTVSKGVLQQSGVILMTQSDHLYPVAEALSLFPMMRGRRVAVVSEGGGPITMAAEALAERGLELAPLTHETQKKIHAIVPAATAISNPVDAGGGTDPRVEYYGSISKAIMEDPNIDALLFVGYFGGYTTRYDQSVAQAEEAVGKELGRLMREHGKPIMVQSHYALFKTKSLDVLRRSGVPFQRHIEIAVQCLASAADYSTARRRLNEPATPTPDQPILEVDHCIDKARIAKRDLLEPEAMDILHAYGIPTPQRLLMHRMDEAAFVVNELGQLPLAVKVVSKDILHKTEAGGVKLNVVGINALESAFGEIKKNALTYYPRADVTAVLVTPMAPAGLEVVIGVTQDPQYGKVIMFGLGGVFVEVIRDVVFRALPLALADAQEMLVGLHHYAVLNGVRGSGPIDKEALINLLMKVSQIATLHPEIVEIDLNPVIAHEKGYSIVDARMILTTVDEC